MRRKISLAFLSALHRKKFENHCLKGINVCIYNFLIFDSKIMHISNFKVVK